MNQKNKVFNVVIAGVGGQGTILTSKLISHLAMATGYDVKQSEVHGMAQRGGTVISMVRFGKKVNSPLVMPGTADLLLSFELVEAARHVHYLAKEGSFVINRAKINPSTVGAGLEKYPEDIEATISKEFNALFVNATAMAIEVGNARAANVVLLGAISKNLPFTEENWIDAIKSVVPAKTVDINIKAFKAGRQLSK